MCGICGAFSHGESAPPVDEGELLRMRERMRSRGPDGAGLWLAPDRRAGLAHRRLSVIDLSAAAAQPMASADGALVVSFNGEIYNHAALRRELEARGRVFRTASDTEVLLHLYAERGPEMVRTLRGMFAFALWDSRERTLLLARDALGIKPLYYADQGGVLRFASQVKALLAGGAVPAAPEPAGAAGFLLWGCVPDPYTLYRGVFALPAGTTLSVRAGAPVGAPRPYFSIRQTLLAAQDAGPREFGPADRGALAEALADSVCHHLVADVPVGLYLSAGVDSSLLAGLAAPRVGSLRTLTLGFDEYRGTPDDETPLAREIAAAAGTAHEVHWISPDDFLQVRASVLEAMDQPSTDGVNSWLVSRAAARAGMKVALSGAGGDELFGGYPSFRDVPRMRRWLAPARWVPWIGRLARRVSRPALGRWTSPKYAGLLEYGGSDAGAYLLRRALWMPWELQEVLDPASVQAGLERLATLEALQGTLQGLHSSRARVTALESAWYLRHQLLRDMDWAGMAHGVEVRVPLVDAVLLERMAPWLVGPRPPTKADAAEATLAPLRERTLARPKTGFSVPVREWIGEPSRGLRGWAREVLPPQPRQFRALALVTDAWGGRGGIAKFNRDFLAALADLPDCAQLVVLPRAVPEAADGVARGVRFATAAAGGKLRFVAATLRELASGPFDLVFCGHVNLAPVAAAASACVGARAMLVIHGIEAWQRPGNPLVRAGVGRMGRVAGVSRFTLERFATWGRVPADRFHVLPNCVDASRFSPGPRPRALARELGVEGRTVLLTLGRMEAAERAKGFDEVLEALPAIRERIPDTVWLACGEGSDRARLQEKARALGLAGHVVFTGAVPEAMKPDYYRLADAFVLPSRWEGFGIVLLEALASGLPVVGSAVDGSREALLEGRLGELVTPGDAAALAAAVERALQRGRHVPAELAQFSEAAFRQRVSRLVAEARGLQVAA